MDVIPACDAEAVAMNRGSCSRLLCLYSLRLRKHSSVIVTRHRMTFRGVLGVQTQVGFFSNYTISLNQSLIRSRSRMIQCLSHLNSFPRYSHASCCVSGVSSRRPRSGKNPTSNIPTSVLSSMQDSTQRQASC